MKTYLRTVRWVALAAGLLATLWACVSHPLVQPEPSLGQESRARVTIVPMRHLDLLFMVDNSPSMKPKQDKMKAQFPNLIEALRDPNDGSLPDLRIAVLDSDVGSGFATTCGGSITYGDKGQFQMRAAADCGANPDAGWLEFTKGRPVNFKGDVSQVFGCLAGNVGVKGCGFEHQLGVFEWAFHLKENEKQWGFLRPEAYLGIVILTDEDDCSAPPDSKVAQKWEKDEAWSLRCATRGHVCDNVPLAFPNKGPVSVPYASCRARTDATCDSSKVDTSAATDCNPLMNVLDLARDVKQLKGDDTNADEKILVAAIYGTPRAGDTSARLYKIDKALEPISEGGPDAEVWDYWPICYDPDYPPTASGYDKVAAEHGAAGGLRIDAFLDQFPAKNRRVYSICESDFGPAMKGIGDALINLMGDLCVPFKLMDTRDEPGLQADCRVAYRIPQRQEDKNGTSTVVYEERPDSLPPCDATHKTECWTLTLGNPKGTETEKKAALRCPAKGTAPSQMVNVVRKPDDGLPDGTQVVMECLSCVDPLPGIEQSEGCDY
jgi:hypothetical protein